jgi:hypothetical protein
MCMRCIHLLLTHKNKEAQRKVFRRNQRLKTFADPGSSNQLNETYAWIPSLPQKSHPTNLKMHREYPRATPYQKKPV